MRCPYCGNPDTRVIDSGPAEDKSSIRRRRSCDEVRKRLQLMKSRDDSSDRDQERQQPGAVSTVKRLRMVC